MLGPVKGAARRYATALRAALDRPCAAAKERQLPRNTRAVRQQPEPARDRCQAPTGTTCHPATGTELSPGYRNLTGARDELDEYNAHRRADPG
jgi:hypothetical protein